MKSEDYIFIRDGKKFILPISDVSFKTSISNDDHPDIKGMIFIELRIIAYEFIEVFDHNDRSITVNVKHSVNVGSDIVDSSQLYIFWNEPFTSSVNFSGLKKTISDFHDLKLVSDFVMEERDKKIKNLLK